jgi:hypothetical protein
LFPLIFLYLFSGHAQVDGKEFFRLARCINIFPKLQCL